MKKSQLQSIIREELKSTLNEGSIENKIADLYAYAGINTKYDNRMVARYGKNVVNQAIAMAPKILAYQKKVQEFAKDLKNSPEGKLLMLIAKFKKGYRGDNDFVSVGDIFNL